MSTICTFLDKHIQMDSLNLFIQGGTANQHHAWLSALLSHVIKHDILTLLSVYEYNADAGTITNISAFPDSPEYAKCWKMGCTTGDTDTSRAPPPLYSTVLDENGQDALAGIKVDGVKLSEIQRQQQHLHTTAREDGMKFVLQWMQERPAPVIMVMKNLKTGDFGSADTANLFRSLRNKTNIFWCFTTQYSMVIPKDTIPKCFDFILLFNPEKLTAKGENAWVSTFLSENVHDQASWFKRTLPKHVLNVSEHLNSPQVSNHVDKTESYWSLYLAITGSVTRDKKTGFFLFHRLRIVTRDTASTPFRPMTEEDFLNDDENDTNRGPNEVDCRQQ